MNVSADGLLSKQRVSFVISSYLLQFQRKCKSVSCCILIITYQWM